jgi:polysaccharide export outer membrane protein
MVLLALVLQQPAAPAAPAPAEAQEYLIGPQDKLDIIVIPDVFSDRHVTVDVDGTFQYKDLGRLKAQDLTHGQVEAEIRELLIRRSLHNSPTVKVEVVEFRSKMIYVNGDGVKLPSSFRVQGNDNLMSAIYQAGGFTSRAGSSISIRRRSIGGTQATEIRIPRSDVEQGTGLAATFHLQDGDVINVPEAGHVFVRGEVMAGGVYDLSENAKTVLDMINAAGGFSKFARRDGITITRVVEAKPQQIKVDKDLTLAVQPNDVIEVPRRRW